MAYQSLADELAGALDDPMEQVGGEGERAGRSLADEFGMNDGISPPTTPIRPRNTSGAPPSPSPARTRRSKKSSASSYHTAHPSLSSNTFPPQSPGANDRLPFEGHLEAGMESLDSMDEVDQSLFLEEPQLPWDGHPTLERKHEEVQEDGRDPLVLLGEHLASANRLLEKLKAGDREDVETGLEAHLRTMRNVMRNREEQLRKMGEVEKEMDVIGVAPFSPSRARRDPAPAPIMEEEEEEYIGWTGLSKADFASRSSNLPLPESPSGQWEEGEDEDTGGQRTVLLLPSLTRELVDASLPLDLSRFSESIHNALSEHTSLSRQMRARRAAVEGHREREEAEAGAIEGIERWDRNKMERGLRGEDDTPTILRRELEEFIQKMEDSGKRMDEMMKTLPPRLSSLA